MRFNDSRVGFLKGVAGPAILAACLACSSSAQASDTLVLGGNFVTINVLHNGNTGNEGGGSVSPSFLNGIPLPFVYCVDIDTNVNVPGTYLVGVTNDGIEFGAAVPNAGKIAYLIDHYGAAATTADLQGGLQAAIWKQVYGANFDLTANNSAATIAAYNADLAGLGTQSDPVSNALWLSPTNADNVHFQGLVSSAVPEPGSLALLVGMGLSGAGFLARRRRSR